MSFIFHPFCQNLSVTLLRFAFVCVSRGAALTFSRPPSHRVPAAAAVSRRFADSRRRHPQLLPPLLVGHRPVHRHGCYPADHRRCRPPPPSLLLTAVVSLQQLLIGKMDIITYRHWSFRIILGRNQFKQHTLRGLPCPTPSRKFSGSIDSCGLSSSSLHYPDSNERKTAF